MADRFWVGGSGNWSDNANHWSSTSGGSGGASLPTSADNVYFDANSFTALGQTVTVNTTASCLTMDWSGSLYSPTLAGASNLSVFGSLLLIGLGAMTYNRTITMASTTGGNTVNTNGITLPCSLIFNGIGGEWTLQSDVTVIDNSIKSFSVSAGTMNTGNYNVTCAVFSINGTNARTVNLGTSTITVTNDAGQWAATTTTTGLTYDFSNSTIKITGNGGIFASGSLVYNIVELTGTTSTISGGTCTISELKIKSGNTTTVSTNASMTIGTFHSDTPGSAATMSCASGVVTVSNASIQDIAASGGATFNAYNCVNVSGNSGWLFQYLKFLTASVSSTQLLSKFISKNLSCDLSVSLIALKHIGKAFSAIASAAGLAVKCVFKNVVSVSDTSLSNKKAVSKTETANVSTNKIIRKAITKIPISAGIKALSKVRRMLGNFVQLTPGLSYVMYNIEMEVEGVPYAGSTITLRGRFPSTAGNLTLLADVKCEVYDSGKTILATLEGDDITEEETGVYSTTYTIPENNIGQYTFEFSGVIANKTIIGRSKFDSFWSQ